MGHIFKTAIEKLPAVKVLGNYQKLKLKMWGICQAKNIDK